MPLRHPNDLLIFGKSLWLKLLHLFGNLRVGWICPFHLRFCPLRYNFIVIIDVDC